MTKQTLDRIKSDNYNIFMDIVILKSRYNRKEKNRDVVLAEIRGYLMALRQLGFITETEKRVLHCYITLYTTKLTYRQYGEKEKT